MPLEIALPRADGALERYRPGPPRDFPRPPAPAARRVLYAAAHVVADPLSDPPRPDWEATLAFRRHLWSLGLRVAEAMDTAQRGAGLDWTLARELIRRSAAEARALGAEVACGAGTDQLAPQPGRTLREVEAAYEEQCAFVEAQGARVVLLASRALAAVARGPEDYARAYGTVLAQVSRPAILHWLGEAFDPALAGYWGAREPEAAMEACLAIVRAHAAKVDGVKVSLLDAAREVEMRRRLPPGVRLYTGDDLHYVDLIAGDEAGHSDALLGVFDAIAPAAAWAGHCLDRGDLAGFRAALEPTLPLARHIFGPPTWCYKTGVVFMAYLNGHQRHFRMLAGAESARSVLHLAEIFRLADRAGLLRDPELAVARMRPVLALAGVA